MSQKQAKRRRKAEKAKAQTEASSQNGAVREDVIDLEDLIEVGNIDEYARVCWSLAKETELTPKAGDVITDFGPCEEHGSHLYRFRLTLQSMMTIAQCVDLETCGEAIRLVASKLSPEQWPCYAHGHQEQTRDAMLHGIEPSECPYCGETPSFVFPSKSIDWPSEIPVKGIDGEEYKKCPSCGSEQIELQGMELNKWGWKISCMDCNWELKQAELLDVKQYCDLMERTKGDVASALRIMGNASIDIETRVEIVAVQTRKILEDIAYAALVSNKDAGDKIEKELKDLRYPKEIFKDIGEVHPNFFPTPVEIRAPSKSKPFSVKAKGVFNREKLLQVYRELSPLAHSTNPMVEPIDLKYYEKKLPVWLKEIMNTLDTHRVMLLHHPNHFYIVKMQGDRDGSVQCTPFTMDGTGAFTCAWPDCVSNTNRLHCEFWGRPWRECTLPEKGPGQADGKIVGAMVDEEETQERVQDLLGRAGERGDNPRVRYVGKGASSSAFRWSAASEASTRSSGNGSTGAGPTPTK